MFISNLLLLGALYQSASAARTSTDLGNAGAQAMSAARVRDLSGDLRFPLEVIMESWTKRKGTVFGVKQLRETSRQQRESRYCSTCHAKSRRKNRENESDLHMQEHWGNATEVGLAQRDLFSIACRISSD